MRYRSHTVRYYAEKHCAARKPCSNGTVQSGSRVTKEPCSTGAVPYASRAVRGADNLRSKELSAEGHSPQG